MPDSSVCEHFVYSVTGETAPKAAPSSKEWICIFIQTNAKINWWFSAANTQSCEPVYTVYLTGEAPPHREWKSVGNTVDLALIYILTSLFGEQTHSLYRLDNTITSII